MHEDDDDNNEDDDNDKDDVDYDDEMMVRYFKHIVFFDVLGICWKPQSE